MIKVSLRQAVGEDKLITYAKEVRRIHDLIERKALEGKEPLGWVNWPSYYDEHHGELRQMSEVSRELREQVDVVVVIGIGGSYLGARAAIEMIRGVKPSDLDNVPEVIYVGHNLSSTYFAQLVDYVKDKEFAICVISKSGTTLEPAIGFEVFRNLLVQQKGKRKSKERIVVITGKDKSILREEAIKNDYHLFDIPSDIGGRYSVLTPVGIFPMMIAGIDVDLVLLGAKKAYADTNSFDLLHNEAYKYAVARYYLHQQKKYQVELMITYEPQLQQVSEWWKQLFAESEGKDGKGIFVASSVFTTDLHSLGQLIQQGKKGVFFESVVRIKKPRLNFQLDMLAGKKYLSDLASKDLHSVNDTVLIASLAAHSEEGKNPNIVLEFASMDEKMFGYLSYFFMRACAMSAYLLGINPFDQPGVEVYKKNVSKLLSAK